jgi:hypothetical protein
MTRFPRNSFPKLEHSESRNSYENNNSHRRVRGLGEARKSACSSDGCRASFSTVARNHVREPGGNGSPSHAGAARSVCKSQEADGFNQGSGSDAGPRCKRCSARRKCAGKIRYRPLATGRESRSRPGAHGLRSSEHLDLGRVISRETGLQAHIHRQRESDRIRAVLRMKPKWQVSLGWQRIPLQRAQQ